MTAGALSVKVFMLNFQVSPLLLNSEKISNLKACYVAKTNASQKKTRFSTHCTDLVYVNIHCLGETPA
jgi:hypothetical protein